MAPSQAMLLRNAKFNTALSTTALLKQSKKFKNNSHKKYSNQNNGSNDRQSSGQESSDNANENFKKLNNSYKNFSFARLIGFGGFVSAIFKWWNNQNKLGTITIEEEVSHFENRLIEKTVVFNLKTNEKTIGSCKVNFYTLDDIKKAHILSINIDENFRKRGLGSKLFKHSLSYIKEQNCKQARLTVEPKEFVINWYKKHGFEECKYGRDSHLVEMQKTFRKNNRNNA